MRFRAVIFDLGGVVLGSPLHAIAAFERARGIPSGFVNRVVVETGAGGAWSRLERGELRLEQFYEAFDRECEAAGCALSGRDLMADVGASTAPRPVMVDAIRCIREAGLAAAALTNNWITEDGGMGVLRDLFDVFVESAVVGLRKPDPRIFQLACRELGVEPIEAVFLDDIGTNLKAARALGMTTIKVEEPEAAVVALEGVLGLRLRG
jgi:epoxide hydrolase-like predicted phosphatase